MHTFFNRPPGVVAKELVGKILQVGDVQATILSALPQTAQDNARWIGRRPIFGPEPVDVYVASYRGVRLMFLRTGAANSCVRIDAVSVDGVSYSSPSKVCKAFGIESEMTGKLAFNDRIARVA